jgi:hypothetical protein
MARSQRTKTAGNVLQKIGRMLSGTSGNGTRRRGRRKTRRKSRRSHSGKGLLRRLLS